MIDHILVLVGGGHSNIQVVDDWSSQLAEGVRRILLSDGHIAVYSGMLPSVVSGILPPSEAETDLCALAARSGWEFIDGRVVEIQATQRKVFFIRNGTSHSNVESIDYTVLSLDVGSGCKSFMDNQDMGSSLTTDEKHMSYPHSTGNVCERTADSSTAVIPTRPIGNLLDRIQIFEATASCIPGSVVHVVVIGTGAAGVELALGIQSRLSRSLPNVGTINVCMVGSANNFREQLGVAASAVARELRCRGIKTHFGHRAVGVEQNIVWLSNGSQLPADLVIAATGAASHPWLRNNTDLQVDARGFVAVEPTLRAKGFSNVFASGDCCSFEGYFGESFPPKAGVYAVREGPVLLENLQKIIKCHPDDASRAKLRTFSPQMSYLSLISLGDNRVAIGTKWNFVVRGRWVYNLKLCLDRNWQARFREPRISNKEQTQARDAIDRCSDALYCGSPAEAAAALFLKDREDQEDFTEQLSILHRMDLDARFLDQVRAVTEDHSVVTR